jgi:hypothetical protein
LKDRCPSQKPSHRNHSSDSHATSVNCLTCRK